MNHKCGGLSLRSVQMLSFFWSVFSRIRTEYVEIRGNADQKKNPYLGTFHAVYVTKLHWFFLTDLRCLT